MERTAPIDAATTEAPRDASALCTDCGLCCDGLFTKLRITPDERPLAERAEGPVLEQESGTYASLPCSYLDGSVCTVYAERYATCRKFTCKLLRGFVAGEVTADTARARVAEMRRQVRAVRGVAASAGFASLQPAFFARAAGWRDLPDKAEREAMARSLLAVSTYNLYANKYFRNVADPAALS